MDLTLDHFLNLEIEQHPPTAKEQLTLKVPVDISVLILVVETNESIVDQSM